MILTIESKMETTNTYYRISRLYNEQLTGSADQWVRFSDNYNPDSKFSWDNYPKDTLPNYEPNLDYLIMDNKSNLTDVLTPFNRSGFIVSDRFKNLMENSSLSLPKHKYFTVKLKKNNKFIEGYSYLHFGYDYRDYFLINKTEYALFEIYPPVVVKDLSFSSKEELEKAKNEIDKKEHYIGIKKYILDKSGQYDIVKTGVYFYASQKFKDIFEASGLIGFKFLEQVDLGFV